MLKSKLAILNRKKNLIKQYDLALLSMIPLSKKFVFLSALTNQKLNKYRRILLTHQNFFLRQIGRFLILKNLHTDYLLRNILLIMVFQLMKQKKLLLKYRKTIRIKIS